MPQAFGLNTLKRFDQPMWRGGNVGSLCATHRGEFFMQVSLVAASRLASIALPLIIWDTPLPTNGHSWSWRLVMVLLLRGPNHQLKPRCEASCRGLRGTGMVISRCREQSPRGTRQHPVVSTPSTGIGRCWWRLFKSP
jgi:hypothetical protein